MLLSGTPIAELLIDTNNTQEITIQSQSSTGIQNNKILDFAQITSNNSLIQSLIVNDYILKGSGTADIDVENHNIVSPGYSPGIQNVSSYSQDSNATLIMEIAGLGGVAVGPFGQCRGAAQGAAFCAGGEGASVGGRFRSALWRACVDYGWFWGHRFDDCRGVDPPLWRAHHPDRAAEFAGKAGMGGLSGWA